ncbi:hypothetical protein FRB94_001561 [Tulasnella sp. JGI-2019a]|nr:hypothetical protein FRB94_001561 [Tulasnella sp. JGI-2019a]
MLDVFAVKPPSQQAVAFPVIGVESHNNGSYWNLRACDEGRIGKRFNTRVKAYTPTGVGVASSKVWSVQMDEDGETEKLCLTWIDNKGTPVPLQAYALPNNLNVPTATKVSLSWLHRLGYSQVTASGVGGM